MKDGHSINTIQWRILLLRSWYLGFGGQSFLITLIIIGLILPLLPLITLYHLRILQFTWLHTTCHMYDLPLTLSYLKLTNYYFIIFNKSKTNNECCNGITYLECVVVSSGWTWGLKVFFWNTVQINHTVCCY